MSTAEHNPPLVSVVAVSYNHERYVIDTLESIRRQTFTNWELIYADDASTDGTVAIAQEWLNSHKIVAKSVLHGENRGLCRTLNEALEQCSGKYVQFIACDDVLRPRKFELQVTQLEQCEGRVALCCSNFSSIDEDGNIFNEQFFPPDHELPADMFIAVLKQNSRLAIGTPTVLIRKDVFIDIGNYDEGLLAEDFDMWLRVTEQYAVVYRPEVLVDYRKLRSSLSRSPANQIRLVCDRLASLTRFNCVGERKKALDERKRHELLELARLYIESDRWDEAEETLKQYVEMTNIEERGPCRELLATGAGRGRQRMADMMRRFSLSSGSRVRDFCYRNGITVGLRLLDVISQAKAHVHP